MALRVYSVPEIKNKCRKPFEKNGLVFTQNRKSKRQPFPTDNAITKNHNATV